MERLLAKIILDCAIMERDLKWWKSIKVTLHKDVLILSDFELREQNLIII